MGGVTSTGARAGQVALAIAPLALDAVAACGGTLVRLAGAGVRVRYLVVYECGLPYDRLRRACRLLGIAPEDVRCLRVPDAVPHGESRTRLREELARAAWQEDSCLVLMPSLRSADPRDALVAREAFQLFRGHTLLSYDSRSRPYNAPRPVFVALSSSHLRAKARAMRPRRIRPGSRTAPFTGPAVEVLDLVQCEPGASLPLGELQQAAADGKPV